MVNVAYLVVRRHCLVVGHRYTGGRLKSASFIAASFTHYIAHLCHLGKKCIIVEIIRQRDGKALVGFTTRILNPLILHVCKFVHAAPRAPFKYIGDLFQIIFVRDDSFEKTPWICVKCAVVYVHEKIRQSSFHDGCFIRCICVAIVLLSRFRHAHHVDFVHL